MGDHGVEQRTGYPHSILAEDHDIEFNILTYLLRFAILQGRGEVGYYFGRLFLVGRNRNVPGFIFLYSERHSDQSGCQWIDTVSFRVKSKKS